MARISLALVVVLCIAGGLAVASSGSSSASRWVATDLLRLARQRYPAYVQVRPIGFGADGHVLWTARRPSATTHPRRFTDGSLAHVFAWSSGVTRDLGSFGQSDNTVIAVNRHDQIAVTRYAQTFGGPVGGPSPPPPRAFLWQKGRFTELGTLGGVMTFAEAIDSRGEIVGSSFTRQSTRKHPVSHAFLWSHGRMTDLATLGGRASEATAINDHGQIAGSSAVRSGAYHAVLWQHGKITDLGTLGGLDSQAFAINQRGQVIGLSGTRRTPRQLDEAFLWQDGKMTDLEIRIDPNRVSFAINDRSQIIVEAGTYESPRGLVWQDGKVTVLRASVGRSTAPSALNDRGQVVGGTSAIKFRASAFVWQGGRMTVLPSPVRLSSTPRVWIDPSGTNIVAVSDEAAGLRRQIVLWTRAS